VSVLGGVSMPGTVSVHGDPAAVADPDVAALLAREAAAGLPPLSSLDPWSARAQDALIQGRRAVGVPLPRVASADGGLLAGVPVQVVTPLGHGPFPVVVHLHGGGWVVGSPTTYDLPVRRLAVDAGAVVVDVDYRLAPEHPYPAALDDGWAVLQEVATWGVPVGVAGDSGGGALAAALTLMARTASLVLAGQLLTYPSVSLVQAWPSWRECASGGGLEPADSRWFADCWAPAPLDRANPLISPMVADSLAGLPPAVVAVAARDPLRDGGLAYAARLYAEGVPVSVIVAAGQVHGYLQMPGLVGADAAVASAHAGFGLLLHA